MSCLRPFLPLVAALTLAACGGQGQIQDRTPATSATPMPTSAKGTESPARIDAKAVQRARNTLVKTCERRERSSGSTSASLRRVRSAARALLTAFERNPDEAFRRSPNTPPASMRDRLKATGTIARKRCGGSGAVAIGTRLRKAAARGGE